MRRALVLGLIGVMAAAMGQTRPAGVEAVGISGVIEAQGEVVRVVAVDRGWADVLKTSGKDAGVGGEKFVYEATLGKGGAFTVSGLLGGRTYDLIVWTKKDGKEVRWEGVNMEYHRGIQRKEEATAEDRKGIEGLVVEPAQFYDKVRVLRIAADHGHATVVVELMRTRDFHSGGQGEIIYRVELWYFENLYGGWAKDKNTEKVVARVRGRPGDWAGNWQFEPGLGGIKAGENVEVKLGEVSEKHGMVGK